MRQIFITAVFFAVLSASTLLLDGCATPAQTAGLAIAATTVAGAQTVSDEIEQIYYLGVFDPREQLPPTIYRVRVHGQSSIISRGKFGSGWAPAAFIDSLSARVKTTDEGNETRFSLDADQDQSKLSTLKTGRRLMMFGPEGFREAPADHRLVIVMGADPSAFFEAIDTALGDLSQVSVDNGNKAVMQRMLAIQDQINGSVEKVDSALTKANKELGSK